MNLYNIKFSDKDYQVKRGKQSNFFNQKLTFKDFFLSNSYKNLRAQKSNLRTIEEIIISN